MQNASLWRTALGVENTVVEDVEFLDHTQAIVPISDPHGRTMPMWSLRIEGLLVRPRAGPTTDHKRVKLQWIATADPGLYRA